MARHPRLCSAGERHQAREHGHDRNANRGLVPACRRGAVRRAHGDGATSRNCSNPSGVAVKNIGQLVRLDGSRLLPMGSRPGWQQVRP